VSNVIERESVTDVIISMRILLGIMLRLLMNEIIKHIVALRNVMCTLLRAVEN